MIEILPQPRHSRARPVSPAVDREPVRGLSYVRAPTPPESRPAVAGAACNRGAGPIARRSRSERFHWLVSPSSTMVQPSPVHTGLTIDPMATLDHLFLTLVERPAVACRATRIHT
ncbi:MAG: DUF3037 domain-containing protein [Chloroflexi bacterium]|nr:DUF3037 domain-containing protein [Chloroflexota bacterium]